MGNCFSNQNVNRKSNSNPIYLIVNKYSIQKLSERWSQQQLNIIKKKFQPLPNPIDFKSFINLFPKLKEFPQITQHRIHSLLAYNDERSLNKQQLKNGLTLIRKGDSNANFAQILFYVYTDKKHRFMTQEQAAIFQKQNEKFLKDHSQIIEVEADLSQMFPLNSSYQDSYKQRNYSQPDQLNSSNMTPIGSSEKLSLLDFKRIFQQYDLKKYQKLFNWDLHEEEKELISLIKKGIIRKKGQKAYILEYQWFLQWRRYVESKYNVKADVVEEEGLSSYQSISSIYKKMSKRDSTDINLADNKSRPPEINNYILLKDRKSNDLKENLSEFSDFVSIPQYVWQKILAIYQGGPTIERIYPQIYTFKIIKVYVNGSGKFIPSKKKEYDKNKQNKYVSDFISKEDRKNHCFYKYPGLSNWEQLTNLKTLSEELFNCNRTYLAFVPSNCVDNFIKRYNIINQKDGPRLQNRLKNYGSEINISQNGVLMRAQVLQILSQNSILVQGMNQYGNIIQQTCIIDTKLKQLNPPELLNQKNLNALAGFTNIGNTCYMNAVLQCLIRTHSFGGYLIHRKNKALEEKAILFQSLIQIYQDSKRNNFQTIDTIPFKKVFDQCCPFFQGNAQHDAQEFLICLLERISEETKSKKQYGVIEQSSKKTDSTKAVRFFSGKTETTSTCIKCNNKGQRIEPFFTYSLSLPEREETEFYYYYVKKNKNGDIQLPLRFGITLHPKTKIEKFIEVISNIHKKRESSFVLYSVFNNQIMSKLDRMTWNQELAYHLGFNVKLVFYQIQNRETPTFQDFYQRRFDGKTIKIELRQRTYCQDSQQFKNIGLPFILQIKQGQKWNDIKKQIQIIIQMESQILTQQQFSAQNSVHMNSQIKNKNDQNIQQNRHKNSIKINDSKITNNDQKKSKMNEKETMNKKSENKYYIRVIKNDHKYQNNCVFCREKFHGEKNENICSNDCGFSEDESLFKTSLFRNIYDSILITVDWTPINIAIPIDSDKTYSQAKSKSIKRKDEIEDLFMKNLKNKETIELRCQKSDCKSEEAFRTEAIVSYPNIFLIHLKRFNYDGNKLVKLMNNVVYPQILVMKGSEQKYELYGTVVHHGSGLGGHYTCFVKVQEKWYKCDDAKVTEAKEGYIDENAYLLFYKKIDFQPALFNLSI